MSFWNEVLTEALETTNRSVCYQRGFNDAQRGNGRNIYFLSGDTKREDEKEMYNEGYEYGLRLKIERV